MINEPPNAAVVALAPLLLPPPPPLLPCIESNTDRRMSRICRTKVATDSIERSRSR